MKWLLDRLNDDHLTGYLAGMATVSLAFAVGTGINLYRGGPTKSIPDQKVVQQGFVAPSDLEVRLADLDHNGEDETIVQVKGVDYVLRYVDDSPVLSRYEVTPARITYGNE